MKKLYSRFAKSEIADLPLVAFPGRIISIITASEAEKAVDYLLSGDILGVDTETKPSFHRGEQHKVCLLQVANRDTCFLFRLHMTGITPAIKRLLEDRTVKKVGLSWRDDIRALQAREPFTPGLFVDLQDMVPELGVKDMSLQKLYANFFGLKISKRQRLSNWEASILSDRQKQYAAIDAWCCINLYDEIIKLRQSRDYELVVVPEPEPAGKAWDGAEVAPPAKPGTARPRQRKIRTRTARKKMETVSTVETKTA